MTVDATAARSADRRASWHSNAPTAATRRVVLGVVTLSAVFIGLTSLVWHRAGATRLDSAILHGYAPNDHSVLFRIASYVTDVASPIAVVALGGTTALALALRRRQRIRALACICAPLLAGICEATLKVMVGRTRPETGTLSGESGFGFPSGHTAGFAALVFTVAFTMSRLSHRRRTAIRIALALSTAIAVTRVIVGAHYPTDVIGGLILGVVVAQITALGSDLATQLPTREPHA